MMKAKPKKKLLRERLSGQFDLALGVARLFTEARGQIAQIITEGNGFTQAKHVFLDGLGKTND